MGNSISLNVLCCRKHHLLKVKIDTSNQSEFELDESMIFNSKTQSKRKDRISSKNENSSIFDDLNMKLSSYKEKQKKINATRFQIKIPTFPCRKRRNSNEKQKAEKKSESIEYLSQMDGNQLKVQNQNNFANKSGFQSNFNLSINTTSSRTQFRTHEYYTKKYSNDDNQVTINPKFNKRTILKNSDRNQFKKFSQNKQGSNKQQQQQQSVFNKAVQQDSEFKDSDKFFEESITSEPSLTQSIERPRIQINQIEMESENKLSPLRIRNLGPFLDKSQDSFNQKLSSNIEDSIAFDSSSQSVCTDLEALNQLADQLKPSSTQVKDDFTKNLNEPKINILINSISSENLFSPDSKLMITTSQDSQESNHILPINRRTQRAMKKLENQKDHAIQFYLDQQNLNRKSIQEKIKQYQSMTVNQKDKQIAKLNKNYKDKLGLVTFDHNQILKNIIQEYKLKKIFTNETVQIRKVCQSIQDLTFSNKTQEDLIAMEENLQNLHQILLKSARKHLLQFLESSLIQSLFELSIQLTNQDKTQPQEQLQQKHIQQQQQQHKQQIKQIDQSIFKLLELIFKSILLIVTSHKAALYYLQENKKYCIEIIEIFSLCINNNSNNCEQDLLLTFVQLSTKLLHKNSSQYTSYDLDFAMYLATHQSLQKLSIKVFQLKDKIIVENSLFIIKYQNLIANILRCLSQHKYLKPVYDIQDIQIIIYNSSAFSQLHILKELSNLTTTQQSRLSILEHASSILIMCLQIQPLISQELLEHDYQVIKKVNNSISDETSEQDLGIIFDTLMSQGYPEFIQKYISTERFEDIKGQAMYNQDAVLFLVLILVNDQDKLKGIDQSIKDVILNYLNQSLLLYEDFKQPIMIEDSLMIHYHNPQYQYPISQHPSTTQLLLLSPQHHSKNKQFNKARPRPFLQNELKLDQDCLVLDTQRSHQPFEYQVFPAPPLSTRSLYSQHSYNSSSQHSQTTYHQQNQWVKELNIKEFIGLNVVQELISSIKNNNEINCQSQQSKQVTKVK